ncbi:MAG: DNA polymerase III subunit delta [Burkholderia sp.]|nr:DNA polymerase III subunit delta [Burkholderia sp.]
MQIPLDALQEHLEKGLVGLYIVYGSEPLLIQETCDRIRFAAKKAGFIRRSIYIVERGFDWNMLINETQGISLFSELHFVELRILFSKPGNEGESILKRVAITDNPNVLMLISLPNFDINTKKSSWFSEIVNHGVSIKTTKVDRAQLPNWINQRLSMQGQYVINGDEGLQTLQFVADRVEGNLLGAHQEIQKLGLLYPQGLLSFEQIYNSILSVARYDMFKISEAILAGDPIRLARVIYGLKGEGTAITLVMWIVVDEIHTLFRIKRGLKFGKHIGLLLRESRIRVTHERLIRRALNDISELVLENAIIFAAQLDKQIKGLTAFEQLEQYRYKLPPDPWDGLFQLAMILVEPLSNKIR